VLTTVCRDDLPDQGAAHLSECIRAVKAACPKMKVEMLAQDFRGEMRHVETLIDSGIDVFAHNVECVERLTESVRDAKAGYRQSLDVLKHAKAYRPEMPTKSSLMAGLGETEAEMLRAFDDLRAAGCDILTIGQYLRPTGAGRNLPVAEFVTPDQFARYETLAREKGFLYVASGPFVRSCYRAGELYMKGLLERKEAALAA
jgi:lipoic acid synthetase